MTLRDRVRGEANGHVAVDGVGDRPLRAVLREWWSKELAGKTEVDVPELAKRAAVLFEADPSFRERFFDEFLYPVVYDYGISMLSERRVLHDGEGRVYEASDDWLEHDGRRHVSIFSMSPEQLRAAADRRRDLVTREEERIRMLLTRSLQPVTDDQAQGLEAATEALRIRVSGPRKTYPASLRQLADEDENVSEIPSLPALPEEQQHIAECCRCGEIFEWVERWPPPAESSRVRDANQAGICAVCAPQYPSALLKAAVDPFDYGLRLRTGELIYFHTCHFRGAWVSLTIEGYYSRDLDPRPTANPPFERGVDVRLSEIVWCADAPFGS